MECDGRGGCPESEGPANGLAAPDGLPLLRGVARARSPRVGGSAMPLHRRGRDWSRLDGGGLAMIVRQVSPWSLGWNTPTAAFAQMRRDMESLMERLTGVAPDGSLAGVFPPMNVSEDRDHYYVRALIPGVDPAGLDVSVVHQTVALSGTRQAPEEAGARYHREQG